MSNDAEDLLDLAMPLLRNVLLRQRKAELEEWHAQITTRNARIQRLERAARNALSYLPDDYEPAVILRNALNEERNP